MFLAVSTCQRQLSIPFHERTCKNVDCFRFYDTRASSRSGRSDRSENLGVGGEIKTLDNNLHMHQMPCGKHHQHTFFLSNWGYTYRDRGAVYACM